MTLFCTKGPFFAWTFFSHDFRHFLVQKRALYCINGWKFYDKLRLIIWYYALFSLLRMYGYPSIAPQLTLASSRLALTTMEDTSAPVSQTTPKPPIPTFVSVLNRWIVLMGTMAAAPTSAPPTAAAAQSVGSWTKTEWPVYPCVHICTWPAPPILWRFRLTSAFFGMGASIALMDSSCAAAVDASNNDFMYTTALDGYVVIILTCRFPIRPIGAFRSLKSDCTNLRHRRMS